MRHRTKTQPYSTWLKLVKSTNPKTGRFHYTVIADTYSYYGALNDSYVSFRDTVKAHFDPHGSRGSKQGCTWKFRSKDQAEKLIMLALLKWGDQMRK